MDYNRVVKDLNGHSSNKFLSSLNNDFIVEHVGATPYKPQAVHEFGLYLNGQWYRLRARQHTYVPSDPIKCLDVTVLSEYVLKPVLGIEDQRTSDRIDFVGGIRGWKSCSAGWTAGRWPLLLPYIQSACNNSWISPTVARSCRPNPPGLSPS